MLIVFQCNLHACSSALIHLLSVFPYFVNVNVISRYVVMQLVNVIVIWFVYCRVNANEVGWLVNRSVAGAVGKH